MFPTHLDLVDPGVHHLLDQDLVRPFSAEEKH